MRHGNAVCICYTMHSDPFKWYLFGIESLFGTGNVLVV